MLKKEDNKLPDNQPDLPRPTEIIPCKLILKLMLKLIRARTMKKMEVVVGERLFVKRKKQTN